VVVVVVVVGRLVVVGRGASGLQGWQQLHTSSQQHVSLLPQ
jgi:hypothetical protein